MCGDLCVSVMGRRRAMGEAEAEAEADGRRGEDLKTRTPHNDVEKNILKTIQTTDQLSL